MQELAIAKRFDKDKDGILNEEERNNCLEALKNGFENGLAWNKDKSEFKTEKKQSKRYDVSPNHNRGDGKASSRYNTKFPLMKITRSNISENERTNNLIKHLKLKARSNMSSPVRKVRVHSRRYSHANSPSSSKKADEDIEVKIGGLKTSKGISNPI